MSEGAATRKPLLWFPFVIALYLVVIEWSERTGTSARAFGDLAGSAAAALLMGLLGWLVAKPLTRDRDRRALISLLWVLWAGLFLSVQAAVSGFVSDYLGSPLVMVGIWTLLIVLLTLLLSRGASPLSSITRILNIASVILLAMSAFQLVSGSRGAGTLLTERAERTVVTERSTQRPDVYVFVLDKYTSGGWLKANYGIDHQPFEDSLRTLGFTVPSRTQAPYAHTLLAVTSLLEGRYVHPSERGLDWVGLVERVEGATLWARMQALGYRYAFFPTTFVGTRQSSPADIVLKAPASTRAIPGETFWLNSPFWVMGPMFCRVIECGTSDRSLTPYPIEHLEELEWKMRMVTTLPDSTGPIVSFMHVLTPHEPFLFNADCSAREPWWPSNDISDGMDARVREAYAIQVRCLDQLLIATITRIVQRSAVPPIILLQGDHGNGRLTVDVMRGLTLALEDLKPDQVGERLSVFAAYRFPDAQRIVPDRMSPVNALRLALGPIMKGDTAMQPVRSYWSAYQTPFSFTEIPAARLDPP